MPDRDGYIPGVPCWADTSQPDPAKGAEFYSALFGWETQDVMPEDAGGNYFTGRIRGRDVAAIGSIPEGAPPMAMWNTYIWVDSVDETAKKVTEAGGSIAMAPFNVMEAGRMAVCLDPEGAAFCLWEAKEHKGSGVVNEHGSVNFNDLNTRDLESAKAFYGEVFGWKWLDMGGGYGGWMLPGYCDHLEATVNPGMRAGMKEMGAPEGFEDVVASLGTIGDDEPDTPAHWGVTFAVDDAGAIAEKAVELGGTVLMPPFDAPWVRMTVIVDPQGATFTASKFVPENKGMASHAETGAAAG